MEVPGYQLTQRIKVGSDHELYLASSQGRLGRFVVRIQAFSGDNENQGQYVANLESLKVIRHPHLCEIIEIGQVEGNVYVVTPFYPGGSFGDILASGMSIVRLIRIATSICDALESLHVRGQAHGDIKPANIVFDDMGSPVLIDGAYFEPGSPSQRFTPGYSAPEMARGDELSATCDVFSLGVLLYRVLHGDLPWHTTETDTPRTRSATDALPPFGPQHAIFQDLIESMVAYDPEERISSIAHVKGELENINADGDLNTVAVKSDLISTTEISTVLPPHPESGDSVDERSRARRRISAVHWTVVYSICLVGIWSLAMGLYQIPETKRLLAEYGILENAVLVEARLNAEALVADPNQNLPSIVAAYESVLLIEPEDVDAIQAINNVRSRWEDDFSAALTQNELSTAQNRLDDLLEIFPDDSRLQVMFDDLQTRRYALQLQSDTLALLRVTAQEPDASADMALNAFREVVRLYPASIEARRELDGLAAHFSAAATREIDLGNLQAAMDALSKAGLANPNYVELSTVRERIQRAATLREEIETRLAEASDLRRVGQLIDPPNRNAATLFHSVLTTDPDNEVALRGLSDVSNSVVLQFEEHLQSREFGAIRHIIERAKSVGLYPASIMHMESSMAQELNNISEAADFVVLAEQLIADGYITEPSDNNALAALRRARQLDATNSRIDELLAECTTRLSAVASDARAFGLDGIATAYSALAVQVGLEASR